MRGFYRFLRTGAASLGIGTGDAAFQRPSTLPRQSLIGGATATRRALVVVPGAHAKTSQSVPTVGITGTTGVYVAGQYALQGLSQPGK